MKKYLLVALLAIGATSFAKVVGEETNVSLPVRTQGEIVAVGKQLVIEAVTAGVAGDVMKFDFAGIVKPTEKLVTTAEPGKFIISRADNSAIADGGTYSGLTIGIGTEAGNAAKESKANTAREGITVDYALDATAADVNPTDTEYVGYVTPTLSVEPTAVVGTFTEAANRVYVRVTKN